MQAFGWASVAIAENGETLEDWQGDIIEPDELESAAYKFVDLYREGGEMHERGGVVSVLSFDGALHHKFHSHRSTSHLAKNIVRSICDMRNDVPDDLMWNSVL